MVEVGRAVAVMCLTDIEDNCALSSSCLCNSSAAAAASATLTWAGEEGESGCELLCVCVCVREEGRQGGMERGREGGEEDEQCCSALQLVLSLRCVFSPSEWVHGFSPSAAPPR